MNAVATLSGYLQDTSTNASMTNPSSILCVFFVLLGVVLSWISMYFLARFDNSTTKFNYVANFFNPPMPADYVKMDEVVLSYGQRNTGNDGKSEDHTLSEALQALRIAREMNESGKSERARRLLEHALALQPRHPDILTYYGEFLEKHEENVVMAEHFYTRALTVNPSHTRALTNQKRTGPLVSEIDRLMFQRIDDKRHYIYQIPENHPGIRRLQVEKYFQHIYHSNAIEGNTMDLLETRSVLETQLAIGGKSVMEHNEILGLDAAMKYINHTIREIDDYIMLDTILQIHKRVLGFVSPLEAGLFRSTQVYVSEFVPPPASVLERLMNSFIVWINSHAASRSHPVHLAALSHYKLVYIHPFHDGNGRTARLLMNLILMRAGFPPVLLRVQDRHEYYRHLRTANHGDVRPFIRFIARCTEKTLDEYIAAAEEQRVLPRPEIESRYEKVITGN